MRSLFFFFCLMLPVASVAQSGGLQSSQSDARTTYNHVPASIEALTCFDPPQQEDCKLYFYGFAHTLDLIFATDPKRAAGDGLCGDISDLIYEFKHEVQTNPKARSAEMHMVLAMVLLKEHNCATLKGQHRIQNNVSAGALIDICHDGEAGFDSCSQYVMGFLSALLFSSEAPAKPILCGDQSLINPLSVSGMLNERLEANFKLRHDPAVAVMLDMLKAKMPCSSN